MPGYRKTRLSRNEKRRHFRQMCRSCKFLFKREKEVVTFVEMLNDSKEIFKIISATRMALHGKRFYD